MVVLKDLDTRIIIGSFSHDLAPKIFCEVLINLCLKMSVCETTLLSHCIAIALQNVERDCFIHLRFIFHFHGKNNGVFIFLSLLCFSVSFLFRSHFIHPSHTHTHSGVLPKIAEIIQAYKLGMYGADYVWILHEIAGEPWWHKASQECSQKQLQEVSENLLIVSSHNSIVSNEISYSGLVSLSLAHSLSLSMCECL